MEDATKNTFKIIGWATVIFLVGFELGMFCSKSFFNFEITNNFNNGSIPNTFTFGIDNATLNKMPKNVVQDDYCTYDYFYSTCTEKPFHNKTGLYCNNTLVCAN